MGGGHTERVRVVVADNEPVVRRGLTALLETTPRVEVVGNCSAGSELPQMLRDLTPDVVIIDVDTTDAYGASLLVKLKETSPSPAILIFTHQDRQDALFQAMVMGVSGYVLKTTELGDLLEAIEAVVSGGAFVGPRMTSKFFRDFVDHVRRANGKLADELTSREQEVFELLARGHTNTEIAVALFLSPHTVRTYRQRIMQKLGFHNRTQLVTYALTRGFPANSRAIYPQV
jgi:DNA-binding NarL/FixJ family response regulator